MNVYGVYKNIRDASWRCLVDYKVDRLPVNLNSIARTADIRILKNSTVGELSPNESGISLYINGKWYIIYDDENLPARSRFTIAHELGHIFLGHKLKRGYHARTFDTRRPPVEREADSFAARLLAPACVLWGLNLHTPEEISAVCGISLAAAKIRSERMSVLYDRNKFLTNPLERAVYDSFSEYIKSIRA